MTKGRPPLRVAGPFFCLLLLACGSSTQPSADDSEQLDNAEEMLNSAADELSSINADELGEPQQNASGD